MTETLGSAVRKTTQLLQSDSDTPHLDAELLVMLATNKPREYLLINPDEPLTPQQEKILQDFVQRRHQGEPIAYISGHKEFWSLDLIVTPDVLIPRPETEHVIEWMLAHLPKDQSLRIADLGVGSGAIAIALAHERPNWLIDATENAENALKIAKQNAKRHHLTNIRFYLGNWCDPLPIRNYTAIVSNPPYIEENDEHLQSLKYEPHAALAAGEDGLDAIQVIIKQAKNYLTNGGHLVFEHGYNQKEKIISLLEENGYRAIIDHNDLAGIPRFITATYYCD